MILPFESAMALLVLAPLAAAAACFAIPGAARWIATAVAAAVGVAAAMLVWQVALNGTLRHRIGGWGAPLGIELRADGLAALLLLVSAVVGIAVTLYAQPYFDGGHDGAAHRRRFFWPLWTLSWAGLNALFLSADVFNLYVTLELLGLSAVSLVALSDDRPALIAAMRYLLVSLGGSLFFLLGVAIVYGAHSTLDLERLATAVAPGPSTWAALALMTVGLLAKGALFPLHFWLPPAHANAPAPVSAVLSALVVKAAFYILLRLWFEAFGAVSTTAALQALGVLGGLAVLWGSIQALVQTRLKLVVAYSTVAQLGYLFLVFPLGAAGTSAWQGALLMLAAHACAKTAMFLAAGNVLHAFGHDRVSALDGITRVMPVSMFAFALAGLSIVGLPPSGGFAGKWLLLTAALESGQWWWCAVLLAGTLIAAAYVMRVLGRAFTPGQLGAGHEVPASMEWTALTLALLAAGMGLAATWPAELAVLGAPQALAAAWAGAGR